MTCRITEQDVSAIGELIVDLGKIARTTSVYVVVESLRDRHCDVCGKRYDRHPVDAEGVVDVCGWFVKEKTR